MSCRLGRSTSGSHLAHRPTVRAVTATTADLRRSFPCRHREKMLQVEKANWQVKVTSERWKSTTVKWCAVKGVNSWSSALFYMSTSGKALFSEKAHCPFDLLRIHHAIGKWSADVRWLATVSDLRDTSEKQFQWTQSEKYNNGKRKQICQVQIKVQLK